MLLRWIEDIIDQHCPFIAIDGKGIRTVALADYFSGLDFGQVSNRPVTYNDLPGPVNGKYRVLDMFN